MHAGRKVFVMFFCDKSIFYLFQQCLYWTITQSLGNTIHLSNYQIQGCFFDILCMTFISFHIQCFRLKKISVCSLSMKTNRLLLGTEGGNIYLLDINSFELQDYVIYQDVVMQRYIFLLFYFASKFSGCES